MGDYLFDRGIYVTMAAYPLVPRNGLASESGDGCEAAMQRSNSSSRSCTGYPIGFPLQRASSSRVERTLAE